MQTPRCAAEKISDAGKSEVPRPVGNDSLASSLDARRLPNDPIKSRGRSDGVSKERDRTGAKTLRKLWPRSVVARAWRMDVNNAFAAIQFLLGWNCQLLGEGGVLHWRKKAPHAGAGPILFAATSERKGWGLSARETRKTD